MNRTCTLCLAAISFMVLVAFFARASALDVQSLWRDEVDALRFATAPWSEMLGNFTRPGWNGPLYYVLLRGWIALAGTSEYAMRFLSLLFGVLSVPLIYLVGRRLFNAWVGIISALLLTASPYLVWYSQEVKMYTLVLALALLAIYSLRRAVEGGGWSWWLSQIVATSLAFYLHVLAALLVPVQVLLYVVWWPQARRRWRGALISLACLTLPYLPLAVWQAPMALRARETGFYPYSLRQMIVILLNGWTTGMTDWGKPWGSALLSLLVVIEVLSESADATPPLLGAVERWLVAWVTGSSLFNHAFRWLRKAIYEHAEEAVERPKQRAVSGGHLALLIWLAVPLLSVWLISLRQPLFTDRYLIWSAPAFYLLVALSLTRFLTVEHWTRWVVVPLLSAILIINGFNLQVQSTVPLKSNFRAAAAYVASYQEAPAVVQSPPSAVEPRYSVYLPITSVSLSRFNDLIIFQIPYGRYTFDYYFPIETYPHAEGLYTNHLGPNGGYLMSEEQAARQMRDMTKAYDTVWLIATEVEMWDERELVQRWLDQHARSVTERNFERVDVYRYELPDS